MSAKNLPAPPEVMIDLLAISCRRYGAIQLPSALSSAFESGKSLAMRMFPSSKKFNNRSDITDQVQALIEQVLADATRRGYGGVDLQSLRFDLTDCSVNFSARVPHITCSVRREAGDRGDSCECYIWFWRGFSAGIVAELGLALLRHSRSTHTKEYLVSSAIREAEEEKTDRRIADARTITRVAVKRMYIMIEAEVAACTRN